MGKIISNGIEYTGSGGSIENIPENIAYISKESEVVEAETPIELTRNDIVDNLITEDSAKVLSATQGKILKDEVDVLNSNLTPAYEGLNLTDPNSSGTISLYFWRVGYTVFYRISGIVAPAVTGTKYTFDGVVPEDYRPTIGVEVPIIGRQAYNCKALGTLLVGTDGTVHYALNSTGSHEIHTMFFGYSQK